MWERAEINLQGLRTHWSAGSLFGFVAPQVGCRQVRSTLLWPLTRSPATGHWSEPVCTWKGSRCLAPDPFPASPSLIVHELTT